jgi:hypothetical protein
VRCIFACDEENIKRLIKLKEIEKLIEWVFGIVTAGEVHSQPPLFNVW